MTTLVLLPSPFLGPAVWRPVATELRSRGHDVVVPGPWAGVRTPTDVVAAMLAVTPPDRPSILVPHSNAGLYVAALAAERPVAGCLFVDASLPAPSARTPVVPPALRTELEGRADRDGWLPPWTRWWSEAEVARLIPDDEARRAVEAEQPRLPLTYLDEVPSPAGWERLPSAYLAFGDTYASARAEAARRGWPNRRLPGLHLHTLVDPPAVAGDLAALLEELVRQDR